MQILTDIKLVVVGDGSIGKTCLLLRYNEDRYSKQYAPTAFQNITRVVFYKNCKINLTLCDTAGQQAYQRLRPLAYKNSDIVLIAFSVDSKDSLINAKKKVQQYTPQSLKIFVGTKSDLRTNNQSIITQKQLSQYFLKQFKCLYIQCSALSGSNVDYVFNKAIEQILISRKLWIPKKQIHSEEVQSCKCQIF